MSKRNGRGPSAVIAERLARCRRQMKACGAGAFLLSNHVDYFYLTGFTGEESAVVITPREVHLITDTRFTEEIKREVPWARSWLRRGFLNDEIVKACTELKIKKLAVQPGHFTVGDHAELKKRMKGTRLVIAPPIVGTMRRLKDDGEIAALRRAIRNAEDAYTAMLSTIRVGQTELEMAARLEYEMKRRGASAPAFPTICAEGPNAAVPHACPGLRKVKRGSAILFDWGASVGRYCSDLTRMVFVGSIPAKLGEVYGIVLEAQLAGIAAVGPGRRMCDVDAAARKVIADAGYGDFFTHGLGHGLGLDVHEPPSLSFRSKEKLEPGMVVTVEPGIYLPGVGGVRIEDDVLVTAKGRRVLTTLDKSLKGAVV
ncbi:MAG: Xaa-Pro peptidase family protein [Planctomycetota bacterium]